MPLNLKKRKIRVIRHKAVCKTCATLTEFYSDMPDEGFGYAAILYANEFGREVFFHSAEDAAYLGSPAEKIVELNEQFARNGEPIKIRRLRPVAMRCPLCDSVQLEPTGEQDEVIIEAYEIFDGAPKH